MNKPLFPLSLLKVDPRRLHSGATNTRRKLWFKAGFNHGKLAIGAFYNTIKIRNGILDFFPLLQGI